MNQNGVNLRRYTKEMVWIGMVWLAGVEAFGLVVGRVAQF